MPICVYLDGWMETLIHREYYMSKHYCVSTCKYLNTVFDHEIFIFDYIDDR